MILLLSEWNISSSQNYEAQKYSSQNYEAQKSFLKEHKAKFAEATKKVVLKGAQRKF